MHDVDIMANPGWGFIKIAQRGKPSHNMGKGPFWVELSQCMEEGVLTTQV